MQSLLQGQLSLIPVIVLIIAIAAIILILVFMKIYQIKHAAGKKEHPKSRDFKPRGEVPGPFPDTPELKRAGISEKQIREEAVLLADLGDITKNLQALVSKYHLDNVTLSTTDGLVIAATGENGQDDAAHYGQVLKPDSMPSVPGLRLFCVDHKGSSVIGIVRSGYLISDSLLGNIEKDTEKIMSWWI